MIANFIVILLILFFGFKFSRNRFPNSDDTRKRYIQLISFILILQSGLRNVAVGADTYAYYESFEELKKTSWSGIYDAILDYYNFGIGKDLGYLVFEKAFQFFTGEYQLFLMLVAILFFTALGNFIYKNTTRLIDAVVAFVIYYVLFYAFFSITGIRQTIATAAALYSFELIKKKKWIPFVIIILVASTIHKSLLLFLPFYFIARISNSKYFYRTVLLLFPVIMINRNSISTYFKVLGGYEEYGINQEAGTFTFTGLFLLISLGALFRAKIILKNNPNAQYFYNAFAVALLFIPLTWVNPSAMRVVQYFSIFMLVLIPEILYSFQEVSPKIKRDLTFFTILVLIALFLKSNWNDSNGYGFFWEEMDLPSNYMNIKLK
jgi:hypothetical protein